MVHVWWSPEEPEGVFVYGRREEGGFGVDLLAGLEEGGLDVAGFVVARAVVEGVLAVGSCSFVLVLVFFFILIVIVMVLFVFGGCWRGV